MPSSGLSFFACSLRRGPIGGSRNPTSVLICRIRDAEREPEGRQGTQCRYMMKLSTRASTINKRLSRRSKPLSAATQQEQAFLRQYVLHSSSLSCASLLQLADPCCPLLPGNAPRSPKAGSLRGPSHARPASGAAESASLGSHVL